MGDPKPGGRRRDERLSAANQLDPGDQVSVAVAVELADGCQISLRLEEQQDLLHPDGACQTESTRPTLRSVSPALCAALASFLSHCFHSTPLSSDTRLSAQIHLQHTKEQGIHVHILMS